MATQEGLGMQTRGEYVQAAPNVRLHVRDWGNGRPVVLIPGWPLSNDMYEYQMMDLVDHGYRPIALTLRGFGLSDKPYGPYNYDVFADDIKSVMDQLDLREVTLCGHSMGAAIAIRYMSRHDGVRVANLAMFGPAAPLFTRRPDWPHGLQKADVDKYIEAARVDRSQMFTEFGKIFCRTEHSLSPGLNTWLYWLTMKASPLATIECLKALRDTDLRPEVPKIRVPTLILHAADDRICPYSFAESLAKSIKDAKLIRFDRSGHALFIEERRKFNDELLAFMG
ncbi:MAG TPA: alpha/beta hydrolase [Phycisphaerae bacterium]|nr:alpha/beta hydrolase [Phycisphaerae bacterium]